MLHLNTELDGHVTVDIVSAKDAKKGSVKIYLAKNNPSISWFGLQWGTHPDDE